VIAAPRFEPWLNAEYVTRSRCGRLWIAFPMSARWRSRPSLDLGRHTAIAILCVWCPIFRTRARWARVVAATADRGRVAVLREFIAAILGRNRIPAYAAGETLAAERPEGAARAWRHCHIAPSDLARGATGLHACSRRRRAASGDGGAELREEAVQLTPTDPAAHNLGSGAGIERRKRRSRFQEALRLAPNDPQARANLERARRLTSTSPLRPRSGEPAPR
jgi:hypothetical protein